MKNNVQEYFDTDVLEELEKKYNPNSNWINNLIILGVSIFLFFSLGFANESLENILIIIAVIFIHELGHMLGMILFKYKNVKKKECCCFLYFHSLHE